MQINNSKKVITKDETLFVIRPSVAIMTVLISICTAKEKTGLFIFLQRMRLVKYIFQHLLICKKR